MFLFFPIYKQVASPFQLIAGLVGSKVLEYAFCYIFLFVFCRHICLSPFVTTRKGGAQTDQEPEKSENEQMNSDKTICDRC